MYTELVKAGIKPENIIFMTYTTNLKASNNPWPGMIFTDPADTTDGDWAQYGCFDHVDYTDNDINRKVFLGIISGDKEAVAKETGKENPKVLSAGPDDTVFTYFIDHGDDGIIMVGKDKVDYYDLLGAILDANDKNLYGKWVWFMEACHSGSMFEKMSKDINVYVMTSADPDHDAHMSNCPPGDRVAGKHIDACMSGLWDNFFLDYVEQHPDCTIGEIFDSVYASVGKSSDQIPSEYGDLSFRDYKLSEFFGELPAPSFRSVKKEKSTKSVPVSEVPKHLAMWRAIRADKSELAEAMKAYQEEAFKNAKKEVVLMRLGRALMNEKAADKAFKTAAETYSMDCVRDLASVLVKKCGFSYPLGANANNMLRNICLPGLSLPQVDFDEICM